MSQRDDDSLDWMDRGLPSHEGPMDRIAIGPSAPVVDDSSLYNIEVEQALLGAIMIEPKVLRGLQLQPEHFFDPLHGQIFQICTEWAAAGKIANPVTLKSVFAAAPPINDEMTVVQYLGRLMANATSLINTPTYADQILDLSMRRKLVVASEDLNQAMRHGVAIADAASVAVSQLDEALVSTRSVATGRSHAGDAARSLMQRLNDGTMPLGFTSGLKTLDALTGGWRRKELALVGARPGMGKSMLMISTMASVAAAGHGVLCFSMEMARDQLASRMLSDWIYNADKPVEYSHILKGTIGQSQRDRLTQAVEEIAQIPLVIDDSRGLRVAELVARARHQAAEFAARGQSLDLVIIDYLQLVRPSERYAGNKVHEVGEISDGLATLAREGNVAVIALAQLNRGVEGRENKRPGLSDLRDTGNLEQDADLVTFLYRPAYYLERWKEEDADAEAVRLLQLEQKKNVLEIVVAKNRHGPCTTLELYANMATNSVRDLQPNSGGWHDR